MADTAYDQPAYLGRLHMRVAGRAFEHSVDGEKLSDKNLRDLYKDTSNIRSKYKGRRSAETGLTSGIPIFNADDVAERTNWSKGHAVLRGDTTASLRALAKERGISARFAARHISAENSHALGHGDYGVDHLLSAPAASKAQNTEQLAIELAMREAAGKLNAGLDDKEQSLVHAKITDVLHPKTGQLMARRYKLIRRENKDDTEGTVVFDHLMDGQRLHISKAAAFGVGKRAHDALMADQESRTEADNALQEPKTDTSMELQSTRSGLDSTIAPKKSGLRTHQAGVRTAIQKKTHGLWGFARSDIEDRRDLNMVGPAHTAVDFPHEADISEPGGSFSGQAALDEMRRRMVLRNAGRGKGDTPDEKRQAVEKDFLTSGSVSGDPTTKMMQSMQSLQAKVHGQLGTYEPNDFQMMGYKSAAKMELFEHFNAVNSSGGDPALLEDSEKTLLKKVALLKQKHENTPTGMILQRNTSVGGTSRLGYKSRSRKKTAKGRALAARDWSDSEEDIYSDSDDDYGSHKRGKKLKAKAKPKKKRKRDTSDLSDEGDAVDLDLVPAMKNSKKGP